MTKMLLSFGDSWPFGAELPQGCLTYGDQLAYDRHLPHKNFSRPATSIENLVLQLQQAIETIDVRDTIAVFTLTSPTRSMWVDPDGRIIELHVRNEDLISKTYFKYIWSQDLDHYKVNVTILALQRICQQYGIDDYYVSGFSPIKANFPGINQNKIYPNTLTDLLKCQIPVNIVNNMDFSIDKQNPFIWPNECHPNQAGHTEIANKLGIWINDASRKI